MLNSKFTYIPIDEEESKLIKAAKEVNGRLQCPVCLKTLSQLKILKLHIRSHVGKNLLHCKLCNRGFAKGSNLNRHMLLHRSADTDKEDLILKNSILNDNSYKCPFCEKILVDRQSFRLHIRHHMSKTNSCNQDIEGDSEVRLDTDNHESINKSDGINGEIKLESTETHKKNLKCQRKGYENVPKNFTCDICHKVFNRKDNLK